MTKHISDKPREGANGRLRAFTQQERETGPHAASQALHSRPKVRLEDGRKTREYTRIERGITT